MTTVEFSPAAEPLAAKLLEPAREILARYPAGRERSALLPLLHLVQTEEGYVSPGGVAFCADVLGINKAQVGAVATFYTMYKRRPTGEYLVSVCTNTLCNVLGGQEIYDELVEHLGVGHDETTADGKITLEHAECLAACDYAPVVTVNYDFTVDQATPQSAVELVEHLRQGQRPTPSRGARICSLKEMQYQLAGFADPREGAVGDGVAGAPTLRGVRLAQEHGVAVAGFDTDTPITKTKPARDESALPPRTDAADKPVEDKPAEGRIAAVAKKAATAVRTAAGAVAEKVGEHRHAGKTTDTGDVKDPEVRAAESRNPTADTPGDPPTTTPAPGNPAEEAGTASNEPAGDGKPAGDTNRGERIVTERTAEQKPADVDPNPGWQNVPRATEEEK
ncbi:NADH-quinone oxidoreductase subunit NuoE [Actinoplanes sp. NEAU-A12]|uniref:NADH-quinone oxidoreductase subunit NuoE n=1 Tax=Actinoplanes sandaracinus TaxID=3045177 RepID=A0ABT6WLU4_9ACTN|nr:NADH-quinone oxidoreductase subunit NuoE [Actinoplanes sandaracinus]MDI6100625.1 NADH-quinone oxidoreductase subunit NuoE [Actinoplanes sandaracinus]